MTSKDGAAGFGARLVSAMRERGLTATGNKAGVDLGALARAASVSHEMARRYAEGAALPRPGTLAAIARWLGVDAAYLLWGASPGGAAVDQELLSQCIAAALEAQRLSGRMLTPAHLSSITTALYTEAASGKVPPSSEMLARLLGLT